MNAHEHTDPHGDGLTITHDGGKVWITCTTAHAEVTVGPLAAGILTDYDMDGGVAAALIEKEAEQPTGEVRELRSALAREIARGNALQDALDVAALSVAADAMTAREHLDAAWEAAYEPECGNVPKGAWFLTKSTTGVNVRVATEAFGAHGVRLLDSPTPARPEWLDAPAVRAWHKRDRRTEHDGTPGKPRIWSPDYGTTETWSTPSLREVPWTDLVDVEPLDVSAELAEGLDRVAEFMRTGGVRVVGENGDPR